MIEVKLHIHKNGYIISSSGHTSTDVCIAVSANINTLHQYLADREYEGNIKINERKYEYGETYVDFIILNDDNRTIIEAVIKAIMKGIKLIQHNFPQQVNFWWGYE